MIVATRLCKGKENAWSKICVEVRMMVVTRLCQGNSGVGQEPRSYQVGSATQDECPRSEWCLQTRLDQQVGSTAFS